MNAPEREKRLLYQLRAILGEHESQAHSERTRNGIRRAAQQRLRDGNPRPGDQKRVGIAFLLDLYSADLGDDRVGVARGLLAPGWYGTYQELVRASEGILQPPPADRRT